MPSVSLSPIFNGTQQFTAAGAPLSGGLINTYLAGTTTPTLTYTDSGGTIANSNPIVLDAGGYPPSAIWIPVGTAVKFTVTDSVGANPRTLDNILGIGTTGGTGSFTDITATGNSILGDNTTDTLNVGNGDLVKDNAGYTGLGVAPTAGQGKIQLVGSANGGIKLGNQNNTYANALDWYEEGVFTPAATFGGTTTGWTQTGSGKFTRIGNLVSVTGTWSYTVKGAAAGAVVVGGFPYAGNASFNTLMTVQIAQLVAPISGAPMAYVQFNQTYMVPGFTAAGGAFTQLASTDLPITAAFTTINFSGTYFV